jgi:MOSC domain-containing protein YiiM
VPDDAHAAHHRGADELAAGLESVRSSARDEGTVELLVVRPTVEERQVPAQVVVDVEQGLVGDNWRERGSRRGPAGAADPEAQVTVMNSRAALLVASTPERMPLAGDQVYVDLDLSVDNLPTGTVLDFGEAALEVTAAPHTGCAKFSARFGVDALRMTATPEGRALRLRGINTRVLRGGVLSVGDRVRVVRPS